ncbi:MULTISPECIES: 2-hydroxyacid dehydrogenase [unclassified Sphingomonas]|uniref:2-hydroxyacid dehydrogenase n=1 Tax=unclassified Sphingomonas TaxID=196159 RepID=UPI0006FCDEEF|nr:MULTISPECIES: 2-hydroxyacid dehydrogenase [unclassified Sphingomonas]KQX20906.1 hydroxyacid dehydrogenase [Sphingomonas sp. Root1294]KQY68752.1 hydroxyacid dehydrogenase [Sphingomonas sp. Root50]KRB88158.1 hydroxyacid dehydrogenase [Sphingomonas sp. Root720]
MSDRPVILVAQPHLGLLLATLEGQYHVLSLWKDEDRSRLAEVTALVMAGEFQLSPELVDALPKLGLIACFTVGYDGVDVAAARARGFQLSHAHDANQEDVADQTIGLILAQRRRIVDGDRMLRAGEWKPGTKMITRSVGGARVGIVGLGSIGAAVARRAEVMRMEVRWWGPNPKPAIAWQRMEDLTELAAWSDILVVAARAHADNEKMISAGVIEALGPDGLLVNVARGQVVDEDALIAALRDGRLGAAALDVYVQEPTPADRWADVPNTVLTPHTGGATDAAVQRMKDMLVANLAAFYAGEPLVTPIP